MGSIIKSVKIDGVEKRTTPAITDYKIYEGKKFEEPLDLELENIVDYNKQIFGFIINIPKNKSQTIEIEYINGVERKFTTLIDYSLFYLKQPGTEQYPVKTIIYYPEGYVPQNIDNISSFGKNILVLKDNLKGDKEIKVRFVKK